MPFASRRQWKWCFANDKEFCHRWAHETGGGPVKRYRKLPAKVKRTKAPKAKKS